MSAKRAAAIVLLNRKRKRGRPTKEMSEKIKAARQEVGQVSYGQAVKRRGGKKLSRRLIRAHRQASRLIVNGAPVTPATYLRWQKRARRAGKTVTRWLRDTGKTVHVLGGRSRRTKKRYAARGVPVKNMRKIALRNKRRRARRRSRR